jgi:hypothetical protein
LQLFNLTLRDNDNEDTRCKKITEEKHLSIISNGVIVNAGVNDVVRLRNLSINGAGNGIRYLAGKTLQIESVTLHGFTNNGERYLHQLDRAAGRHPGNPAKFARAAPVPRHLEHHCLVSKL